MAHQSLKPRPIALLLQDPIIIIDWTQILEGAGIDVRSAGSFETASIMLDAEPGITHFVSDVAVHLGPSVKELLGLLNSRRRPLKVVVTSKRTSEMDALPPDTVFLQKSILPQTLIDSITV